MKKYLQGHPSINFPESFALINFKEKTYEIIL